MASTTTIPTASSNNDNKDKKYDKDDEKIIVFAKICRDRYGNLSNKHEDVYYKEIILNGKPCFERVYLNNKNNNNMVDDMLS